MNYTLLYEAIASNKICLREDMCNRYSSPGILSYQSYQYGGP